MYDKNIVNIDDDSNVDDEWNPSLDRLCTLFV